jgi:predicted GNAT superfamily acetyltransferase
LAIRDATERDEAFILALNAASMPAVSDMSHDDYREIVGWAHCVLVAEFDEAPCGFLILIGPGSAYDSDNYGWFEARFDRHLYIDRIAVAEHAKGQGVGRALYEEAARIAAKTGDKRLTCEVNVDPPNPQSMAFHTRLGFHHVHTRPSAHGKIVAMLEKPL